MPVRHISSFVSNFRRDREGAVAVIVALAFPVLVGVLGLGTEVGYWYKVQADMQRAVDLATHAGAVELAESGDEDKAIQAAYSAALLNSGGLFGGPA
ncbi:MAG: pilus assembly protein [Geminicoccaceae bacterium]|nr:pilus assembly protein [Geminicoccaceae bacterium]